MVQGPPDARIYGEAVSLNAIWDKDAERFAFADVQVLEDGIARRDWIFRCRRGIEDSQRSHVGGHREVSLSKDGADARRQVRRRPP